METPSYTESVGGDGPATGRVPDPAYAPDAEPLSHSYADANALLRQRMWRAAADLYRRRFLILGITVLVAAAAVALTLRIPNQYKAETRVLLPSGGGNAMSALAGLAPAAAALLGGGGGGGFTRYMAILTSPSTMGEVVDRFDLIEVYDLSDERYPREAAVNALYERASFDVSIDFDYLAVSVLDEDPERSAQIANHFVELLNDRNVELTSSSAAANRRFLERRLDTANLALDSAQVEMQALQERSGVVEPTAQAEALFSSLAIAQGRVAEAEAQYQAVIVQAGPDNAAAQSAAAALASARSQVSRLRSGDEAAMPIAISRLPAVQREYASVMQDVLIQTKIIETIQPLYEQAALEEQREADAVQVLDVARPPHIKAAPKRSLLVLGATLSAFIVVIAVVLALAWMRRGLPPVLARLRSTA